MSHQRFFSIVLSLNRSMTKQPPFTKVQISKLLFLGPLLIIFILIAFDYSTPPHPMESAFLSLSDVPAGWRVTEQVFHETGGKVSYQRRDAYIKIGRTINQYITVFDSHEEAVNEYMHYKERHTDEEELSVYGIHLDSDNAFINCFTLQTSPFVEGCAVYLVHNNVFMVFSTGIYEDDGFTFQNFHILLIRAYEKLKQAF